MTDLLSAIEESVSLLLVSGGIASGIIFKGQSDQTQVRPCVVIHAQSGEEFPLGSGNQFCPVSVMVKSKADGLDEPELTHKEFASQVFQLLQIDDLANQLSAQQPDLSVFGYRGMTLRNNIDGNSFVSELQLDLYCCQMSLA
jgi:hypothetical protein